MVHQFVAILFVVTPAVSYKLQWCWKAPSLNGDSAGGKIMAVHRKRSQLFSESTEGYDTFGNLVCLSRNHGKSRQKSLEIRKSIKLHFTYNNFS